MRTQSHVVLLYSIDSPPPPHGPVEREEQLKFAGPVHEQAGGQVEGFVERDDGQ